MYMGSLEDLMSYTEHYYNIVPTTGEDEEIKIAAENLDTYNTVRLEESQNKPPEPLRVCITNASSDLAYHLASRVVLNKVFGDHSIHLQLLDTTGNKESVHGLAMELHDLAHPNLCMVTSTDSVHEAFKAVSAVFVLDEFSMEATAVSSSNVLPCNSEKIKRTDYEQIFGLGVKLNSDDVESRPTVVENEFQEGNGCQTDQTELQAEVDLAKESSAEFQDGDKETKIEEQNENDSQKNNGLQTTTTIEENESAHIKHQDMVQATDKENQDIPTEVAAAPTTSQSTAVLQEGMDSTKKEEEKEEDGVDDALLHKAATKYELYGGILDYAAQKDVRVVIVGQFSNTGAALMAKRVSSIDKKNFISSSSLAERQASSILAAKLGVAAADVQRVGIWGWSQGNVLPDPFSAEVFHYQGSIVGPDGFSLGIKKCLFDYKWLKEDFPAAVLDRHANSCCYGERNICLAEAVLLGKLMKDWWIGAEAWHSVGVVLEGEDVAISYPCVCRNGVWEKIENACLEDGNAEKLAQEVDQLKKEFEKALSFVSKVPETATPISKL